MIANRADYIAGLRALADLLDKHDDVPLPYGAGTSGDYDSCKLTFYCESKDELLAIAKAFPGKLDKRVDDEVSNYGFELHGTIHGLHFYAAVHRDEVCERVVTGTREVERDVVVTPATTKTVVETEDVVEWVCSPLLSSVSG